MSDEGYPPRHHVLRDLPFEIEVVSATQQLAHLEATDTWSVGALATVVDVLGGSLCAGVVAPDWMATSSLTLRVATVPTDAPLVMDATVLRAGRRSVTIEVQVRRPGVDGLVGDAVLAFSRLERRDTNLDLSDRSVEPGARYGFEPVDGAGPQRLDDVLGQTVTDAAGSLTETHVTPYLLNSFGAVNGGVVAAIAAGAARAAVDPDGRVDEVAVHHLGQGRQGPVRTAAGVVLASDRHRVVRVELRDAGVPDEQGGRVMAVAHVGVCTPGPHV
jgi:acyl-coenzyme A thioesterase PaaI-like protein